MTVACGVLTVVHDRLEVIARDTEVDSVKEPGCRAYGLWTHL